MNTKPETDVMAGVDPAGRTIRKVGAFSTVPSENFYTSTQINEQFAKVMAEKDAEIEGLRASYAQSQARLLECKQSNISLQNAAKSISAERDNFLQRLAEMQRELDEATEYRNQLRQQLAEAQAQLKSFVQGVKISIPTDTMEQEFARQYRAGYEAAIASQKKQT